MPDNTFKPRLDCFGIKSIGYVINAHAVPGRFLQLAFSSKDELIAALDKALQEARKLN